MLKFNIILFDYKFKPLIRLVLLLIFMFFVNSSFSKEYGKIILTESNVSSLQCVYSSCNFSVGNYTIDFNKNIWLIVFFSLILLFLLLVVIFGRIEIGFITVLPSFLSWLWLFAIFKSFNISLNFLGVISGVIVTLIGTCVSAYVMSKQLRLYSNGKVNEFKFLFKSIVIVLLMLIVTIILFYIKLDNSVILILLIGLLSIIVLSYLSVPFLFKVLISKNGKSRAVPITFSNLLLTMFAFSIFVTGCMLLNIVLLIVLLLPIRLKFKKLAVHYCMMYSCRALVYCLFPIKKKFINQSLENFKNPAIIISNHQSHIDLLLLLGLHPKIVVLTTSWVWNSPFYGYVIRFIDFFSVNEGNDILVNKLKRKVEEGYSILVFPEGSRTKDQNITRFHKGAFYLAKQLNLDVIPVLIHGAGDCMLKGENYVRSGKITVKIYDRILDNDVAYGKDYHELSKSMQAFCRLNYEVFKTECETPKYLYNKLIKNYIYKGPLLEWYGRIKVKLEDNYNYFNQIIPKKAEILDIGCGYGFMSYMLGFLSENRVITGIDYDKHKIDVAKNCISKNDNIQFFYEDASIYNFKNKDVFILSDILHYINEEKQTRLIENCINHLNENGMIIIRDGDKSMKKRHLGTRYTEFFSTNFGFNKLEGKKLHFTSQKFIVDIAKRFNLQFEIIDNTKLTSNVLLIIRK